MKRSELEKHIGNTMRCKKCGATYKFEDVVAIMDSCELPGNAWWINGCKNCGGINYDESSPDDIHN